jgi:hypothetical protein
VVERTGAWFNRGRRPRVWDERRADMHTALISLAASLIPLHFPCAVMQRTLRRCAQSRYHLREIARQCRRGPRRAPGRWRRHLQFTNLR